MRPDDRIQNRPDSNPPERAQMGFAWSAAPIGEPDGDAAPWGQSRLSLTELPWPSQLPGRQMQGRSNQP